MDDSRKIREKAANSKQAVVIGGGFIGMEVASVLSQKKIETTMVSERAALGAAYSLRRCLTFLSATTLRAA